MTDVRPASDDIKSRRRPLIARLAVARRKRDAMLAIWVRRREELRAFEDDDKSTGDTDGGGNPDVDLDDLTDVLR